MNFDQALQASQYGGGLYEDEQTFVILPAKIWSHHPDQRNYVIVDISNGASSDDRVWYDIFLKKGERTNINYIREKYEWKRWYTLCDSCRLSDRWHAWTLDELFDYNSQDLINDPTAPRGFLVMDLPFYDTARS